jgi:hypothetical protein
VLQPNSFDIDIAIEKLTRCKLPCIEQMSGEFVQPKGKTLCSEIYKLIDFIWSEEELPEQC